MRTFRSLSEAAGALRGCAVAIGNFDGVHLGHRQLFQLARAGAAARGGPAVALTFEPHPVRVLRPALAPPLLTPLSRKLELLAESGLDAVVVQPFDLAYAASDAAEFVARDLVGHLGAAEVVVGHDFTAGKGRTRVDGLRQLLAARGVALTLVDPVAWEGLVVSSTKIRELLLEGQVEAAAELLGRPHDVEGEVVRGAGLGRQLGFATANLRAEAMLPANGVYAVRARLGSAEHLGVANVGVKPTVQRAGPVTAETHLLDVEGRDLYGEWLRVGFVARLREERRFPSLEALRRQIEEDVSRARELLASMAPM
ncbi:MAG TPA: bifunctional riboflavin kinase/FAD synthetase [Anaeromyxobacteraceae bacterium]|nr:bifunctional riboflavin kinase/FAD synthetase [Anaeromyxobacteraceae bacterium]